MTSSDQFNQLKATALLQAKELPSAEDLLFLLDYATACATEGTKFDFQGKLNEAEYQYLQALKIHKLLWEMTGAEGYADAAAENCMSLADLCMQQGNMHGADYYYAHAMQYRRNSLESWQNSGSPA